MYPTTLKPLLTNPAFIPNDITEAASQCAEWFKNTASVESFVFLSIFRNLQSLGWNHQGMLTSDWNHFLTDVLPRMVAVLDTLPADPSAQLRALVIGYHSSI